ncbi:type VII secretion target [Mycolicibacterium aubagnense]|uniref:PE family protein n=1 Tax=Mycolicibacterium aubagnense TaxID=319707 RepID=A0ABM7IMA9_9MYCO|nr:type VII secretion target [Mycolicibacterium aubagnense]TLH64289.1 hypothetical protein C1S80_12840 [Mycolicibacterium aubagnense]BBX87939.1 hypothetical protein MAUB_58120 [Mycolicibacterium aubagnense]
MSDVVRVDAEGLASHAAVCDSVADALSGRVAPTATGHITQASTSAVTTGHGIIDAVTGHLAARATSFGYKLRVASGVYVDTDEAGAGTIAAIVEV